MQRQITSKMAGILLIVLAIVLSVTFIYISSARKLSDLENTLFQTLSLGLGLFGSYKVGSSREAAKEIIKPYAKSAFRRLFSLYRSLSRVAGVIEKSRPTNEDGKVDPSVLYILEAIVTEQLDTADDALEDWRDIVPEEVEEVRSRVEAKRSEQQKSEQQKLVQ
jgi:hypothetical protein